MPSSVRRALTAVGAVCSLGLLAFTSSASAATPVAPIPATAIIVIPSPDQVSNTLDASRCPWLKAYVEALTSTGGSRSVAVLLAAPLIAAGYSNAGQ